MVKRKLLLNPFILYFSVKNALKKLQKKFQMLKFLQLASQIKKITDL